jgi:hypothetical protein
MIEKRIVRNPFIGYTFDIVEMEYSKYQTNIVNRLYEGLTFRECQIIMGVNPNAPIRDSEGDRI